MLIAIVVATVAVIGVLLVFYAIAGARPMDPVQARLSQLGSMQARTLEEIELQQPLFERALRPMAASLSGVARRIASPQKVSGTEKGFMMPELWLSRRVKKRQKQILLATPDTLDLLTISVRAGLSFDGALAKVVEKVPGPLSDEFQRALAEVRVGKARRDALRDVIGRTEVPALSNFIGAIVQAEQLGVPIAKVLQIQSEQLRIERRQRAEELAAKAPIKMLFPLVGCIFPSMFIVILGPAIILIAPHLAARP